MLVSLLGKSRGSTILNRSLMLQVLAGMNSHARRAEVWLSAMLHVHSNARQEDLLNVRFANGIKDYE